MSTLSIQQFNDRFNANGAIRFEPGNGNLTRAVIKSPSADAEIYIHGAHVTHYQPRGQQPVLFTSTQSAFAPGKAIRGGVPVIFPWFGPRYGTDKSQMHGFVRILPWEVVDAARSANSVSITFSMQSSDATRQIWPQDFHALFSVTVGPSLKLSLEIRNTSKEPFDFDEGLHTYFAISDIKSVWVEGLKNHHYRDRNLSPDPIVDASDKITFADKTDRLYRDARGTCTIHDPGLARQIVVAKENSATTVVWNPWQLGPNDYADLAREDWEKFVCVESCNARENALKLAPNQTHVLTATITTRPL